MGKYSLAHRVCFFVTIIIETDDKAVSSLWCQKCEFQRCSVLMSPKAAMVWGCTVQDGCPCLPRNSKELFFVFFFISQINVTKIPTYPLFSD